MGVAVTFPNCPPGTGGGVCVRVNTHRDATAGSDVLPSIFGGVLGIDSQSMRAMAIAQAGSANFSQCLKPWLIPDRWEEHQAPADAFNPPNDVYIAPTSTSTGTGWSTAYVGTTLLLKAGNPNQAISPSDFYEIEDAANYEEAIVGCELAKGIGDTVWALPGNRVGPTNHGVDALLANGPVTVVIAMFSPADFAGMDRQSGRFELTITNMLGFRIEGRKGNAVYGTIVAAPGEINEDNGTIGGNPLVQVIRLVR